MIDVAGASKYHSVLILDTIVRIFGLETVVSFEDFCYVFYQFFKLVISQIKKIKVNGKKSPNPDLVSYIIVSCIFALQLALCKTHDLQPQNIYIIIRSQKYQQLLY